MNSKELLREFYYQVEQKLSANDDEMLGALNSAYCQIKDDLDLLDTILKYIITNGESLMFKNVSCKKNKDDFKKIVLRLSHGNKTK